MDVIGWLSSIVLLATLVTQIGKQWKMGTKGVSKWLFIGQLAASMVLLPLAPDAWRLFVTVLSLPSAALMALAEYGVRRWRFRREAHTPLLTMIRGVRSGAFGRTP